MEQGFRFVQSTQFVRCLPEAVEQRITEFDGFGEPSYESIRIEKLKSPGVWSVVTIVVPTAPLAAIGTEFLR